MGNFFLVLDSEKLVFLLGLFHLLSQRSWASSYSIFLILWAQGQGSNPTVSSTQEHWSLRGVN